MNLKEALAKRDSDLIKETQKILQTAYESKRENLGLNGEESNHIEIIKMQREALRKIL